MIRTAGTTEPMMIPSVFEECPRLEEGPLEEVDKIAALVDVPMNVSVSSLCVPVKADAGSGRMLVPVGASELVVAFVLLLPSAVKVKVKVKGDVLSMLVLSRKASM